MQLQPYQLRRMVTANTSQVISVHLLVYIVVFVEDGSMLRAARLVTNSFENIHEFVLGFQLETSASHGYLQLAD
jgi:hypothetical protein